MKSRLLTICVLAVSAFWCAMPASATGVHYGTFGNLTYPDCQYEAAANLVLSQFPQAQITTNEVLRAWREFGINALAGLTYLEDYGFDGYHAATANLVTGKSAIIAAANGGGIWADLSWGHVVAVVHANPREVTVVDDGLVTVNTWQEFYRFYDAPQSALFAISWAPAGTEQITFAGSYETSTMVTQVEPTGVVVPIEALGMVNDGYTFDGWTTNPGAGVAQYQSGEPFDFTHSMTLYALWTYTGS